jgi:hypothetical protein
MDTDPTPQVQREFGRRPPSPRIRGMNFRHEIKRVRGLENSVSIDMIWRSAGLKKVLFDEPAIVVVPPFSKIALHMYILDWNALRGTRMNSPEALSFKQSLVI